MKRKVKVNNENKNTSIKENISIFEGYLKFIKKHLLRQTIIYFLIGIAMYIFFISTWVNLIKDSEFSLNNLNIFTHLFEKLKVDAMLLLSSVVPYLYLPVVGFIISVFLEIGNTATIIALYGYKLGLFKTLLPFILINFSYAVIISHALYLFNMSRIGFKLSNLNSMNVTVFRIRFLEMLRKKEEAEKLTKKHIRKKELLEAKKEKINYLYILLTFILTLIIQLISVTIYKLTI